jgi:ankyrin repeat protein
LLKKDDSDIQKLFSSYKNIIDVNAKTSKGFTPLMLAASSNRKQEIFELLVRNRADLNARDENGYTPINYAAMNRSLKSIESLKVLGADLNAIDDKGCAPIHHAVTKRNSKIIEFLARNGANLNAQDSFGDTPITYAIRNHDLETVRLLIRLNADLNIKNSVGFLPIHFAASSKNLKILELFAPRFDVDVNAKCDIGKTPIFLAALDGKLELVELLVKNGARVECSDFNLVLAAARNGFAEITDCLVNRSYFAPLDSATEEIIAAALDHPKILEILLCSGKFPAVEQTLSACLPAGLPEGDELSDVSEDSESLTELELSLVDTASVFPTQLQMEFDYYGSVETQFSDWKKTTEKNKQRRKNRKPFEINTHTDRPVIPAKHALGFLRAILDVVKRENYSGEIIIISGQGRHSKNGVSEVKTQIVNLLTEHFGVSCQEEPGNPGRLRLRATNGMFEQC